MTLTRRFILCILLISMALSMAACGYGTTGEPDTPPDSAVSEDVYVPTPDVPAGYTGTTDGYIYRYADGRDREWEEDILFLAQYALENHPYLTEMCETMDIYRRWGKSDEFYDPELRELFIQNVDALIGEVPQLDDMGVLYGMQKVLNTLHDMHSIVWLFYGDRFPIAFEGFYEEDGLKLYTVMVPADREDAIFCQLYSVNGYTVDEVFELLTPYTSQETQEAVESMIINNFLPYLDPLRAAGIIEKDADAVEYVLLNEDGEKVSLKLTADSYENVQTADVLDMRPTAQGWYAYARDNEVTYWFDYILEENTVYVRVNAFLEMEDMPYGDFYDWVLDICRRAYKPAKLIVDLRDNGGGYQYYELVNYASSISFINDLTTYILIDTDSASAAVLEPVVMCDCNENAYIVGTPAMQSPIIATNRESLKFPNHEDHWFRISTRINVYDNFADETLMPDIEIYPTFDDYKNGVDTILEAVKAF